MEGKVIRDKRIMGYVLHRVLWLRRVAMTRKHKRENFLFLCDGCGDFGRGRFERGSKVIGSSE